MQSELPQVTRNTSQETLSPNFPTSSQHGRRFNDQPASPLSHNEERRVPQQTLDEENNISSPLAGRVAIDPNETTRLSQTSPSPRNRIAEYENALTQSGRKRSDSPVFEIIKKSRKSEDSSLPIASLPNGTLVFSRCSPFCNPTK